MSLSDETRALMNNLYRYVRSGEAVELPGVDVSRLGHYRRLVRNIFDDTLRRAYPMTVDDLAEDEWSQLIDAFMDEVAPQTPYIWKMPYEFYEFVVQEDFAGRFDRPYLDDLLFFEWIEIELFTMPDQPRVLVEAEGDFWEDGLVASGESRVIELEYPIHRMGTVLTVLHRGQYFVLAFRRQDDGEVRFVELSPVLAFVWQELQKSPLSGRQLSERISKVSKLSLEEVKTILLPFFNDLFLQGAILGFVKETV